MGKIMKVELTVLIQQLDALGRLLEVRVILLDKMGEVIYSCNVEDVLSFTGIALKNGMKIGNKSDTYIMYWESDIDKSDVLNELMNALIEGYNKLPGAGALDSKDDAASFAHRMIMTDTGEDELTGVYTNDYFMNRMRVIDRSAVIPVALICININDWKYANDNYGDDESDRLIKIVADILKEKAKPEYVIGRTDGDVFHVIIPMAEKEEAQTYCANVKDACLFYDDEILTPSVAAGIVMKTNVEEHLMDFMSEVEYEMFADKCEMKQEPGYRERLTRNE